MKKRKPLNLRKRVKKREPLNSKEEKDLSESLEASPPNKQVDSSDEEKVGKKDKK